MKTFRQQLASARFSVRNSWPVWYGLLNRDARRKYAERTPTLTAKQQAILADLVRDGIAFALLDDIFPVENMLAKLQADMTSRDPVADKLRKKEFLRPFWGEHDTFDLTNPFFALSLRPEVLSIVNGYDRMWRRLNVMTLNETKPVGDSAPVQSQRWHRDPQEKRQVKTFIYLNDVDEETGPFTYVKGSQFGSPVYGGIFKQDLPLGIYPPEGAVEQAVNPADIVTATARAGSIIFCDTAGLHRGGYAKSKSRFMYTAFYPSSQWTEPRSYGIAPSVNDAALSPEARFALYLD